MSETGFGWILCAVAGYGVLHSLLAANRFKRWIEKRVGTILYRRFYRIFFVLVGATSFLPLPILVALLPDRPIYRIPAPWSVLTLLGQITALTGLGLGAVQTGALSFLGITQALNGSAPEKLVVNGLYHWVRHPLYTFSLLLIWLTPSMTWNILALNLGITAYLWIGSIFEERKLVEQYGQEYETYRKRTPRIIPGIRI